MNLYTFNAFNLRSVILPCIASIIAWILAGVLLVGMLPFLIFMSLIHPKQWQVTIKRKTIKHPLNDIRHR